MKTNSAAPANATTYITVKKRKIPKQAHLWDFYGDMIRGYFILPNAKDRKVAFCSSRSLENRNDIIWMLVPKQLSTGKLIAWPNAKIGTKLVPLTYLETTAKI